MYCSTKEVARSVTTVAFLLVAAVVMIFAMPAHAERSITGARARAGPEAADRVHQIMATDAHLRAAIAAHERRGQPLMLDAATVIVGHQETDEKVGTSCTVSEEAASLARKTSSLFYDNVELIFMPDAYSTGYWDGTVEARQYDSQGNLVSEYLADVTGQAPDSSTELTVTYQHVLYSFDWDSSVRVKVGGEPSPSEVSYTEGRGRRLEKVGMPREAEARQWRRSSDI